MSAAFPTTTLLQFLQSCKRIPQTREIAARLGVTQTTVIKYLHLLENEGVVEYTPRVPKPEGRGLMSVIALTDYGRTVKPPQPEARREPNLLPCGHPRTSLPYCLPCRNQERRRYCSQNKTVLPVLRSQMRRVG